MVTTSPPCKVLDHVGGGGRLRADGVVLQPEREYARALERGRGRANCAVCVG